nr:hypothetical protein CFP56_42827 [Quercus suber]
MTEPGIGSIRPLSRFQISQSSDSTALHRKRRAKSERLPRLIRSALESGWCRWCLSVGLAPGQSSLNAYPLLLEWPPSRVGYDLPHH